MAPVFRLRIVGDGVIYRLPEALPGEPTISPEQLAAMLADYPEVRLTIEGHYACDREWRRRALLAEDRDN